MVRVVIQVSAKDKAKAWGILVRHSMGTALPNRTFIISDDAARELRTAGVRFKEFSRDSIARSPQGTVAGERI